MTHFKYTFIFPEVKYPFNDYCSEFPHLGKGGGRGHKISDYFEVGSCSAFIL